jgi:predicted nucleic acid-binding protein
MKKQILVDADVIVDFLCGYEKAVSYVENHSAGIVLSSIVVAELYAGVKDEERARLDDFVSLFPILPITSEIAKAGGLFKRDYHKSYGIGLADALMAATAVTENAELKTLNTKHYPMLKGLKAPYIKR